MFQSTHPHGVRQALREYDVFEAIVSIHAPAWGATVGERGKEAVMPLVSIHAPAWGATLCNPKL